MLMLATAVCCTFEHFGRRFPIVIPSNDDRFDHIDINMAKHRSESSIACCFCSMVNRAWLTNTHTI